MRNADEDITRDLAGQSTVLRRLAPLCLAMFTGYLAVSMPLPVVALLVHDQLGFGTVVAGLAVGLQPLANLAMRPWAGRAVDRTGAKPIFVRGLCLATAANLIALASTAADVPVLALAILLAGRIVLGIAESLIITGILTWAVGRAGPGRAGQAISWNGVAQYSALAAGAPVGVLLFNTGGFATLSVVATAVPLIAIAIVTPLAALLPSGGVRSPLRSVVARVFGPGSLLGLAGLGFAALTTFASLMFAARGWPGGGLALTAFGMAFAGARLIVGHLPDRLGGMRVAAGAMGVEAIGQLTLWLAPSPAIALTGAAITGIGCSLIFPSLALEALRQVGPQDRGTALGAFAAFQDLALGIAGPLLGVLILFGNEGTVFLGGCIAAVLGAAICSAAQRRLPYRPAT